MKLPSNSISQTRTVRWFGAALIVLISYALLSAIVLLASFTLLQRGIIPDLPWISGVQQSLYMRALRNIWQRQPDCVVFDDRLIYKPKEGACQFANAEFSTILNFSADGRSTGKKPSGVGIAVIGDSHAMGWGVQDEESFAALLQQLSQRPVFNLAVSSYGTVRELLRLEESGILDKVDTVILQYCENDLSENRSNQINSPEENRKKFEQITKGSTAGTSSLLRAMIKAYRIAFSTPFQAFKKSARPIDFAPHYDALMHVIASHPALQNKRVLIFYSNDHGRPFSGFPAGQDKQMSNIEFVDLSLLRNDYYRLDDHLTAAGHRNAAERLFAALKSHTGR